MSKRGVNSAAVVFGDVAVVSHGEENLNSSVMGLVAALDATSAGEIGEEAPLWQVPGFLGGYSSGVADGNLLYQLDNSANLAAFSTADGARLWTHNLGTIQRASPVLADGKLYVGTGNGRFFILRPSREGVEVLDEDELGSEEIAEEIIASAAVSDGVVYVVSSGALYAIGERRPAPDALAAESPATSGAAPVRLVLSPTEEILAPGDEIVLTVNAFDALGNPTETPADLSWSVAGFAGAVEEDSLKVAAAAPAGAGKVTVEQRRTQRIGALPGGSSSALELGLRCRGLPSSAGMGQLHRKIRDAHARRWRAGARQASGQPLPAPRPRLYGSCRRSRDTRSRRTSWRRRAGARWEMPASSPSATSSCSWGRISGLKSSPGRPLPGRTTAMPFAWEPDTWYSMKFQVVEDEGGVVARGKVWPRGDDEPADWTLEWREELPHREGTPGVFADAVSAEVFFDNIVVEPGE